MINLVSMNYLNLTQTWISNTAEEECAILCSVIKTTAQRELEHTKPLTNMASARESSKVAVPHQDQLCFNAEEHFNRSSSLVLGNGLQHLNF